MTSTVVVTAHCPEDTEVQCGYTRVPMSRALCEVVTLQNGESTTLYIYDDRIAVALERKKDNQETAPAVDVLIRSAPSNEGACTVAAGAALTIDAQAKEIERLKRSLNDALSYLELMVKILEQRA
jgi:hypothetical protein